MRNLILSLALSLGLTELFECGFALCAGKRKKALLLCVLVNLVTNPPVVLLHYLLGGGWPLVVGLEAGAVLTEGWLYRCSGLYNRPFLFSLAANGLSFSLGLVIRFLL